MLIMLLYKSLTNNSNHKILIIRYIYLLLTFEVKDTTFIRNYNYSNGCNTKIKIVDDSK